MSERRRNRSRNRTRGNSDNSNDGSSKRQWIAGGLAIAFGYAALVTTGLGVVADPIQTFIHDASWQQAPLHLMFSLVTGTIGATAMAMWDRVSEGRGGPRPER